MINLDSIWKSRDFSNSSPSPQSYGFSSSHVWTWELDYKEHWAPKKWCFWAIVLEKALESPLNCKEIQPVHPKGDLSWIFIGRTDAEAETPTFWPSDVKNWLIGKDPDAGKDWKQEEKGMTEDEMVGWHHWLDGREFEQVLGVGDGQGSLACCSPWGCNNSDMTEWLNWTLGKGWRFPGIWPLTTPWSLASALELSLEVPCILVSFSLLTEDQDLIKVYLSAILDPLDSNMLMLCLGLCHSFPHITTVAFNITVILVYAPTVMLKKLKLNGSMKTYKTC